MQLPARANSGPKIYNNAVRQFNPARGPASGVLDAAFLEGYLLIQLELDRQRAAQHLAVHQVVLRMLRVMSRVFWVIKQNTFNFKLEYRLPRRVLPTFEACSQMLY